MPMEPPIFSFRSRNACSGTEGQHELQPGQRLIQQMISHVSRGTSVLKQAVSVSCVSGEAVSAVQQRDAPAGVPACP